MKPSFIRHVEPSATRLLVFQGLAKLLGRDSGFLYQYFA